MNKIITALCFGVFWVLAVCSAHASIMRPVDSVYYYIKTDTSSVYIGYLRADSTDTKRLVADDSMGDYALWTFAKKRADGTVLVGNDYYIINKATKDTLMFSVPVITDTVAKINESGDLVKWEDLFDEEGKTDSFLASNSGNHYYITYNSGVIMLSHDNSANRKIQFSIERPKTMPVSDTYYKLKIDTLGLFAIDDYLRADTVKTTKDSLAVDTVMGDLSMWKFQVDTVVMDTTYFKIYNKETSKLLAFDIPSQDTVAVVKDNGTLNLWKCPFFTDDNGVEKFVVCDTATNRNYYLGLNDSVVMLLTDTATYKCMSFKFEEGTVPIVVPPVKYLLDSTQVYKVKYMSGPDSGKYMSMNLLGDTIAIDSVYAHIPDGQYVVNRFNTYSIQNRIMPDYTDSKDSLYYVVKNATDTVPNQYVYNGDTVEIVPITYGGIASLKTDPSLGFKYFLPADLSVFCYTFNYSTIDTLSDRLLGYGADSLIYILDDEDSVKYTLEQKNVLHGASKIGSIAQLTYYSYALRSVKDTLLYVSLSGDSTRMNSVNNKGDFYFKEDTIEGEYYFVESQNVVKLIVDSTKYFKTAPLDTVATTLFYIEQYDRPTEVVEEPDPYTYLTALPKGKGLYNITTYLNVENLMLTKNYYDEAVFRKEGQSIMLRSGSYSQSDFMMWVDTARGPGFNPIKPSFYIIKDAQDTTNFKVSGYFLHVMDSTSQASHENCVVTVGGKEYNRVHFVKGARYSANEILLESENATLRDSVGFVGKNETAINEYRFYLQETDVADEYYIVTEANYGGETGVRGYLSSSNGKLYVGPRGDGAVCPVTITVGSTVANEVVRPVPAVEAQLSIIGGNGSILIRNAAGQKVSVFNVVGQLVANKVLSSDNETIPVSRGIAIVKVGTVKTQKVVVK